MVMLCINTYKRKKSTFSQTFRSLHGTLFPQNMQILGQLISGEKLAYTRNAKFLQNCA